MPELRIVCEACKSRFRLDSSLFQGAKAIRFRCRKCGGYIMVPNPESPPGSASRLTTAATAPTGAGHTFQSATGLWQARLLEARKGITDAVDVSKTEDFMKRYEISDSSFVALQETGEAYLRLVKGTSCDNTYTEDLVGGALCFFPRLLKVETVDDLPPSTGRMVNMIIDETFLLGLVSHLILSDHPDRHKVRTMNKEILYLDFLEACGSADRDMKEYNKEMNGIPGDIFQEQFTRQVQPLFAKEFSVGFWKMRKIRSAFRTIFFDGVVLGLLSDAQAGGYQNRHLAWSGPALAGVGISR